MQSYEICLIKVSVDDNNNKFWKISVNNGISVREWGRVGAKSSTKKENLSVYEAQKLANKKMREGYQEVNLVNNNFHVENNPVLLDKFIKEISENDEILSILKYCQESNIHSILDKTTLQFNKDTGLFSTPLGIVTDSNLEKAENLLLNIKNNIKNKEDINKKYVEEYLTLIPQKVGKNIDPINLFGTEEKIDYQQEIIESLKSSLDTSFNKYQQYDNIKNPFNVKISPVDNIDTIDLIKNMFMNNKDHKHSSSKLKFSKVFNIDIKIMSENACFNKDDGRLLWHGTRVGNVLSIMKNGMKIINSKTNIVTGRMFGDGLYFSDISTKALNYSLGTWNGVGKGNKNKYYALVCSVFMGKIYEIKNNDSVLSFPVSGHQSTFAPKGVRGLQNNEMIVYNENQVIPMYLVEFNL